MAFKIIDETDYIIVLSRSEAANLIAFLTGLLADEPINGNHAGSVPQITVYPKECKAEELSLQKRKYFFVVE